MPKYHEIVHPIKEIVRGIGEFVINKIVPEDVLNGINEVITGQSADIVADEVSECDMAQFNKTADRFIGKISMVDLDSPWELTDGE